MDKVDFGNEGDVPQCEGGPVGPAYVCASDGKMYKRDKTGMKTMDKKLW